MDTFIKLLPVIIPIILSTIGYIIWSIRLEGKVKTNTQDITELKTNQKEEIKEIKVKIDNMSDKLTELCVSIGEITGYMKRCNEEKR